MPHVLRGCFLFGALLLLAGCGFGESSSRKPAPKQPVTREQLAAMVLPKDALGATARGLVGYSASGPTTNARFAAMSVDPEDTGSSLGAVGRVLGHDGSYVHPRLASLTVRKGVMTASTGVELLEDNVYATQYLHARLNDYERLKGPVRPGLKLRNVTAFEVAGIGEEGGGVRAAVLIPGLIRGYETSVVFRRGRVVGYVNVTRAEKRDARQEAMKLAVALDRRIQSVLSGEIKVRKVKPSKLVVANRAARKRLPEMTMAAADVSPEAKVYDEGKFDGEGFVGYERTFHDVLVGGSHLVRLRALTQAYESKASAVLGLKFIDRAAGRQAFAKTVVNSFANETGVRPTNVRVSRMASAGRGMKGVVVTFELVGAKFQMASVFARSGRFVQSVTGICRTEAFDPRDLNPLAQRAQVRLLAA
jgi:hypothetical protein